jgi:hypothetical protein
MIIFSDTLGITNRAEEYQKAQESVYYPIELLSREIRDAKNVKMGDITNCPNGIIVYTETSSGTDEQKCYFLNSERIAVKEYDGANWSTAQNLSTSGVKVTSLSFSGYGTEEDQDFQPYVKISTSVVTDSGERKTEQVAMDLETSVTLRNIDWKFKTNK